MKTRAAMLALALSIPFTSTAFAADWLAQNMNLQYDNGSGTATATRALFHVKEETFDFTDAQFDVRWSAGALVIERPLDSFSYTVETEFLKDVRSAQVTGLNFEAIPGKLNFGVTSAHLDKVKDPLSLDKTTLACLSSAREVSPIDSCIDYGRLNSAGVEAGSTNIKEASLSLNKGKLAFAVNLKGIGNIKGEGTASHDAATKVVTLKISKVKLSILDVTGQFFSQLKDIKSDMIRVERPYIYVNYAKKEEPKP